MRGRVLNGYWERVMCSISNASVSLLPHYMLFLVSFYFFLLQVCSSSDVKLHGFQNFVVIGFDYCCFWISFRYVISFGAKDIIGFTN